MRGTVGPHGAALPELPAATRIPRGGSPDPAALPTAERWQCGRVAADGLETVGGEGCDCSGSQRCA